MGTSQSAKKRKAAAEPAVESAKSAKARLSKNGHGSASHQRTAATQESKATAAASAPATQHAVEQFLYAQAELLDGKRWQQYIDLFTDDGHYWMPASPEQTTGEGVPSIFYEDKNLMNVRMRRVQHPDAWSQRPLWGTNHLVSNVLIEAENSRKNEVVVRSRFHMMEFRRETSRHFGGSYIHHLVRTPDGFRIRLQRVDMVNAQGPFDYVLQVWV
jgi:benzoate/toluate 1,2-dioxygenase beta subunit